MLQQIIIAIHLMVVVALVILVLYQKSEGGALGMGGGQGNFFTGRGQANALTRATSILGTIFFLTSIALTLLPAWEQRAAGGEDWTKAVDPADIQFRELKPGEKAPPADPSKETIFDQLQKSQMKRQQSAPAPAAPPVEAPKVEAPKVEAPKVEAPKVEAPKPAEAPALRPTQEPAAEAPKAEPVKPSEPEAPKFEAPKVDAPKAETPKPAEPAKEAPAKEASPKAEAPKPDAPKPAEAQKPVPPTQWKSPTQ